MIKCQYCPLTFTAADQVTADNAYILHVGKEHPNIRTTSQQITKEKKFKITCLKCNSEDCTYFINAYDSCSEMGIKCNSCDNTESDWN